MKKHICYLAAGWFNPIAAEELTKLEEILSKRSWIDLRSPRKIFICPPGASQEIQDSTFSGNLQHIKDCDFVLGSTRDKDLGATFEFGYAFAFEKDIVYFAGGLPAGALFNLMLSRSGKKCCTTFEQLEMYLDRCEAAGCILNEPYAGSIE